eukprot:COSAG01_NODE_23_length_37704_cov_30.005877_19_plen_98_part_00
MFPPFYHHDKNQRRNGQKRRVISAAASVLIIKYYRVLDTAYLTVDTVAVTEITLRPLPQSSGSSCDDAPPLPACACYWVAVPEAMRARRVNMQAWVV